MGFNAPASLTLPASTPVKVGVCRQASYPVWADQTVNGMSYGATWRSTTIVDATAPTANYVLDTDIWYAWEGNQTRPVYQYPQVIGASSSPWGQPLIGTDNAGSPNHYIYVPGGWTLFASISKTDAPAVSALVTANISYQIWNTPGENVTGGSREITVAANFMSGGRDVFTAGNGVWVTPMSLSIGGATSIPMGSTWTISFVVIAGGPLTTVFSPQNLGAGYFTINAPATVSSFLPLVAPSEFSNSALPWSATRLTAVGFLGTNVSQVLNKAGTILGGRASPSMHNMFNIASGTVNNFHPAEKAWLPLETGVYTYTPPSTDLGQFWDYTGTSMLSSNTAAFPVFRLDNDAMYNVMFLTAGSVAESLAVTVSWHLEFRTSSSLFQISLSGLALETLHQAQLALASAGYFFCNPDHKAVLSRIVAAARKLTPGQVGHLKKAMPMVHKVVRKTRKAHKYLKEAPKNVKPKTDYNKMKATSARGSGITAGGGKGGNRRR